MTSPPTPSFGDETEDSYSGATEEYDPFAFYTGLADEHGHSDQLRIRAHFTTTNAVRHLLETGALAGTGIDSMSSFMRDAAVHNLHRLAPLARSPEFQAHVAAARRRARVDTLAARLKADEEHVAKVRALVNQASASGDVEIMQMAVVDAQAVLTDTREPYATELRQIVMQGRSRLASYGVELPAVD